MVILSRPDVLAELDVAVALSHIDGGPGGLFRSETFSMTASRLYVHVLLDRSGSMEECRDKTIDAFNEFTNGLKTKNNSGTRLSLTTFDSESMDLVIDAMRIGEVPRLTRETFVPRASTPLLDAVGHAVAAVDKVNLLPDERVVLSILTDGLENASREYTAEAVRKLLVDRQERCSWLVQYLGANQDAWAAGRQIGVQASMAMDYDTASIKPAMQAMSASIKRYAAAPTVGAAKQAADFTPAERAQSRGGKKS